MRFVALALALALPPSLLLAGESPAQPLCDDHRKVVEALSKGYSERLSAVGMVGNGGVVEVFASPGGGTWSIVVTQPDGNACIMAVGTGWESAPPSTAEASPTKDGGI